MLPRLHPFRISFIGAAFLLAACAGVWLSRPVQPLEELFDLAVASLNAGEPEPAEHLLRTLQRAEGYEQHCELLHGGIALKAGDIDEALTCFSRIRPEGEIEQTALLWTGEALYLTGQLSVSLDCFRRIIRRSPDDQAAIRWIAAINFDLCAMDDALRHLQHLLELNPEDFAAHRLMGTIYYDFEKWDEAGDSFQQAYLHSNGHPIHQELGHQLARSLLKEREYDKAAKVCDELVVDGTVLTIQAECAWVAGDIEKATELLNKALDVLPDSHEANLLLGRIKLESGQLQLAVANLEAAIRADPFDFDAHFLLTTAFRQLGLKEQAAKQFVTQESMRKFRVRMAELNNQAIENPSDFEVRLEIAQLCRSVGHIKLAEIWEKAAQGCKGSKLNTDRSRH